MSCKQIQPVVGGSPYTAKRAKRQHSNGAARALGFAAHSENHVQPPKVVPDKVRLLLAADRRWPPRKALDAGPDALAVAIVASAQTLLAEHHSAAPAEETKVECLSRTRVGDTMTRTCPPAQLRPPRSGSPAARHSCTCAPSPAASQAWTLQMVPARPPRCRACGRMRLGTWHTP